MKKFALVFFVAALSVALVAPAFALENQFGGYFRTRFVNQTDFDGVDNDVSRTDELQQVDTRTRLYYTAIINDNLKFVNKFEFDAVWGDNTTYGDIGADAVAVEIKNSYIDFNWGEANVKMGAQGGVIHRGFMMDDDFSGVTVGMKGLTFLYAKISENDDGAADDAQLYHVKYALDLGGVTLTPTVSYSDLEMDNNLYFLGLDLDGAAGGLSYWGTFIYEGGSYDDGVDDLDVSAFLIGAGAGMALTDAATLSFEAFYATGDDDDTDDEINDFLSINFGQAGQSYYWAEIMGYGIFDEQASNGSCADKISDIMAAKVGVDFKVSEKLSVAADLWYAQLAEDNANGDKDLGTEVDLSATYTIVEGLNLDLVAAYLFAGDATTNASDDDADPIEVGARFSISF